MRRALRSIVDLICAGTELAGEGMFGEHCFSHPRSTHPRVNCVSGSGPPRAPVRTTAAGS